MSDQDHREHKKPNQGSKKNKHLSKKDEEEET